MSEKKFPLRVLNVLLAVSLLLGMLPFEAMAAVAPPPEGVGVAAAITPQPQSRQADVMLYLPLVLRGYAAGALPVTLSQSAEPWLLLPGDVTTYTLVVQNPGSYPLESGELIAEAPEATQLVTGSISNDGIYDAAARQVRWDLPEMAGGESLTVTFRAQVTANEALSLTTMAFLTATLNLGHVFTDSDSVYLSVGEAETQTLTAAGGVLTVPGGHVSLIASAGAVTQTTPVRLASFPVPFAVGASTFETSSVRWLVFFDVSAVGAAGALLHDDEGHTRFLLPLTATIDVESTWEQPFLVHMTGESPEEHTPVPAEFDREAEVLTATLQMFSQYGAGEADPYAAEGTSHLMTNQPGVGMFNGAATYSYQLDVPQGRRGLTPKLALNYSSSGMNSLLGVVQSGDVGMGWNLGGQVQIVRPIKTYDTGSHVVWQYNNEFVLTINGTSYNLEDFTVTSGPHGCRYAATDGPGLKVMRYTVPGADGQYCGYPTGAVPPANGTGEYWEVTTGDGTVYRLGYDPNSQQLMRMSGYNLTLAPEFGNIHTCSTLKDCGATSFGGYAGELRTLVASRWAVDQVRDVYGNEIVYGYSEETRDFHDGQDYRYDRGFHLDWIRYGGNPAQGIPAMYLIDVILEPRTDQNDTGLGKPHDVGLDLTIDTNFLGTDWSTWDSYRVGRVQVCVSETGTSCTTEGLLSEYDLDYEFFKEASRKHIYTTRLQSITRYGWENGTPVALPPTTFGYVSLSQDHPTMHYALNYPRLQTVNNGYGGVVTFTYEPVSQLYVHKSFYGDNHHTYTNYRVLTQSANDGLGHTSAVQYTYNDYCFNFGERHHWSCNYPGAEPDFSLAGHGVVTQTVTGYAKELLAQTTHYFHKQYNEEWRMGRESATVALDAAGTWLQQTQTQWVMTDTVNGATFTYAAAVTSTDYTGATPLTTWKKYEYNPKQQGDQQLGLVTHVTEYDSQGAPKRMNFSNYLVNTEKWIMAPWINSVFMYRPDSTRVRQATSIHYYDANYAKPEEQVLDKGALTLDRKLLMDTTGCSSDRTVDVSHQYDAYGNVVTTTTYANYGQMNCTASGGVNYWSPSGAPGGGGHAVSSVVSYDAETHMFPVSTCAAVGTSVEQCSHVEYYGINGDAGICDADGFFFGAVCRQWGPNNADTATHYHYDAFGRKVETWLPGEALDEDPSERISYSDVTNPTWRPVMATVRTRHGAADTGQFSREDVTLWQRVFYDGLGRTVQRQTRTADWTYVGNDGNDIVQYTLYDGLGRTITQSVPYVTARYVFTTTQSPYQNPDLTQAQTGTEYDMLSRVTRVSNPDGSAATTQYAGRETTVVDANGHQMRQTVDDLGRMVLVQEFTGTAGSATGYATTQYTYDILDNLTAVTDTVGNRTLMSYDGLGRKLTMDDPDMGEWSYVYNPAGSLTQQTDPRGCTTTFAYDDLERLTWKNYGGATGCVQPSVNYIYDEGGATQYALGQRTRMQYAGDATTYAYDVRGRLLRATQAFSGTTLTTFYTYDELDRPVSVTYPDGEVVTTTYDNAGYPLSLTNDDLEAYVGHVSYNEMGSPTEMTLGNGAITRWGYKGLDGMGDRIGTTEHKYYQYGLLWRTRVSNAAGEPLFDQVLNYDRVGNVNLMNEPSLSPETWPAMTTATFSDTFGVWPPASGWENIVPGRQVSAYDAERASTVLRNIGTGVNESDARFYRTGYFLSSGEGARMLFKVGGANTLAHFTLLANDPQPVSFGVVITGGSLFVQYQDRNDVERTPTELLTTLGTGWYTLTLAVDDVRGMRVEVQSLDASTSSSYNLWVATGLNWRFQQSVSVGFIDIDDYYEFSTAGMTWNDEARVNFAYDPLNRLTGVTPQVGSPFYTASYRYDRIGNLTYKREGSVPGVTYTYPATLNARPHAVTALSDGSTFAYDPNGNMTQRVEISGTERITYTQGYDAENRLTVVTNTVSGAVTRFRYDGDGARIAQITDEGTTLYAGDLYEEFHEAGASVVTATKYYYLGSQRVAMRAGAALFYLHSDYLGSASLTTDTAGAVVSKQRYYPFGAVREQESEGDSPTDFGFTGQRLDDSTGLMYYRARYYAAGLGRFVSADTMVPGAASGAGGAVLTLGYDSRTRLTPLTVSLGEFVAQIGAESREVLQFGPFFQWDARTRRQHNIPMGPGNPQALNRYSYVLNNPLRYVDPTGYYLVDSVDVDLSAEQVQALLADIDACLSLIEGQEDFLALTEAAGWIAEIAGLTSIAGLSSVSPGVALRLAFWANLLNPTTLILAGATAVFVGNSVANTKDDLKDLYSAIAMASGGGTRGVHLKAGSDLVRWGIEVNGQEVVGHLNLPLGAVGMMFTKGQANFTPALIQYWWHFRYENQRSVYLPYVSQ